MRNSATRRTLKLVLRLAAFCLAVGLVPVDLDPASHGGVAAFKGVAEGSTLDEASGRGCGDVRSADAPLLNADIERKWGLDWDCDGPLGACPY